MLAPNVTEGTLQSGIPALTPPLAHPRGSPNGLVQGKEGPFAGFNALQYHFEIRNDFSTGDPALSLHIGPD